MLSLVPGTGLDALLPWSLSEQADIPAHPCFPWAEPVFAFCYNG